MIDLWRSLYSTADRLFALAPWSFLEGDEPLGVLDPITGEIGFLHVVGQAGEHLGISRYPGEEGLRVLRALQGSDFDDPALGAEILLDSCQLQLSWEDREAQEPEDKKVIKALGLKYRGGQAWPLFRSYEPSLYPWFLNEAQGRALLVALEQGLEIFQQFKVNPSLVAGMKKNHHLVRVQTDGIWRNDVREVLPAAGKRAVVSHMPSLAQLKGLPKVQARMELDLILSPAVTGEGADRRPYFPYLLLMADAASGQILPGLELLQPFPSVDAMYGKVAERVCASLLKTGAVPVEIRVRRELLAGILAPLANELGLRIKLQKKLPKIEEAAAHLTGLF